MNKRILVVEDQEDNLQILRDILTSAGFAIIEAKDGEAGVRAAVTERPIRFASRLTAAIPCRRFNPSNRRLKPPNRWVQIIT
jgi:CheY-like chemotaxis protein